MKFFVYLELLCLDNAYIFQLHLNVSEHGLTLETGIYICKINPGSLAAKEGNMAVGDRVLSVSRKVLFILYNF